MERHGDLVETPRGEDRSAAASLAARDEVAAQRRASAQSTIDDVALEFGSEIQKRIEDIPHYKEAEQAVAARAIKSGDYDDLNVNEIVDDALLELDQMRKLGELTEAEETMLAEFDELNDMAEKYAEGYETLAGCVLRHG
jgi:hypothetical protein